jgi:orotidine-5'-phosphate decarboxylase
MRAFKQLVVERQMDVPGRFCIGLDPDSEKIPAMIKGPTNGIRAAVHMMGIVDATHTYAAAFKPQRAHWEALDDGIAGLRMVIAYIHTMYPDIPVFLDCKRGDIDRTQLMYGRAHFVQDEADGMNFNPYMGSDCLAQLAKADPTGVANLTTLGRTSNPPAWKIQDAMLTNGLRVWEYTLTCALEWANEAGVLDRFGVVMGAAHKAELLAQYKGTIAEQDPGDDPIFSRHLSKAREIVGDDALFLVPGIGNQGGFTEATLLAAWRGPGTVIINQSSGMSQASLAGDWEEASEIAARDQCNKNGAVIATLTK